MMKIGSALFVTALLLAGPALAAPGDLAAREMRYLETSFPGRYAGTPEEDKAARYIGDRLVAMGYRPRLERFPTTYELESKNPDRDPDPILIISTNVIAERPGTSGKQIIIGAHFDTRVMRTRRDRERRIGGPDLQGLDDNASGVGVVLELAEQFAKANPTHSIKFVFFGAEEIGLKGAYEIARNMSEAERANTVLMINIDSVITGDQLYIHAGPKTLLKNPAGGIARDRALALAKGLGISVQTNPGLNADYPKGTGCCSDQAAFDQYGIPAINMEATNWELGDKDGYQQTDKRAAFPGGYSWHLIDIDKGSHLEPSLAKGRVDQRASDAVRVLSAVLTDMAVKP
jgi:alkaline phosphatase isozyme conversion protein